MAKFNEFGVELPDNYETLQEDELAALADGYEDMARAAQEARMKLNLLKKGITSAERKKRDKEYSENYMRYIRSAEQVRSRIYEVKHRTEAATVKLDSFMRNCITRTTCWRLYILLEKMPDIRKASMRSTRGLIPVSFSLDMCFF